MKVFTLAIEKSIVIKKAILGRITFFLSPVAVTSCRCSVVLPFPAPLLLKRILALTALHRCALQSLPT